MMIRQSYHIIIGGNTCEQIYGIEHSSEYELKVSLTLTFSIFVHFDIITCRMMIRQSYHVIIGGNTCEQIYGTKHSSEYELKVSLILTFSIFVHFDIITCRLMIRCGMMICGHGHVVQSSYHVIRHRNVKVSKYCVTL